VNQIHITLAVEDQLSETVLRCLLDQSGRPYHVCQCLCRGGFGYLKDNIGKFNKAARGMPFLVLTDLDNPNTCPPDKIKSWLSEPTHPNMLFRIAVVEIESWILAHREAIAKFLGVQATKIPADTDSISDPKRFLVNLARKSRFKIIRQDVAPPLGATSQQGPNYNACMGDFIRRFWRADLASENSQSLRRTLEKLRHFEPHSGTAP
jgi:hypothetical protein